MGSGGARYFIAGLGYTRGECDVTMASRMSARGLVEMDTRKFEEFAIVVRRSALMFLGDRGTAAVPEASRIGSEGTEGTEGTETTERSESSENSEYSETTERSEGKELERAVGSALSEAIREPLAWKTR